MLKGMEARVMECYYFHTYVITSYCLWILLSNSVRINHPSSIVVFSFLLLFLLFISLYCCCCCFFCCCFFVMMKEVHLKREGKKREGGFNPKSSRVVRLCTWFTWKKNKKKRFTYSTSHLLITRLITALSLLQYFDEGGGDVWRQNASLIHVLLLLCVSNNCLSSIGTKLIFAD